MLIKIKSKRDIKMKRIILLACAMIVSGFAGDNFAQILGDNFSQKIFCGNESLSYCINHFDRQCESENYAACRVVGALYREQKQYSESKKCYELVCDKANSKDSFALELINGKMGPKVPIVKGMKISCYWLGDLLS